MKTDNYDAWKIKVKDFPEEGNTMEKTKFIAKYGVLAPSVHNSQPWIFESNNLSITIKPDYTRRLTQADPKDSYLYMSIGGCAESIEIAARYFGYIPKRIINKDNSVTVTLKKSTTKSSLIHPDEITKRFSNKFPYQNKKVPLETLEAVIKGISTNSSKLIFIQEEILKSEIINLHVNAAKKTLENKRFTSELLSMFIPNNSKSYTGMPGFVSGMSALQSHIAPKVIRVFPKFLSRSVETRELELLKKTAGFGIICINKNSISSMIEAGGLYQRMSILLGKKQIHNAMIAAIIMNDVERNKLKEILNISGRPFLLFRFGYPLEDITVHTPRKTI